MSARRALGARAARSSVALAAAIVCAIVCALASALVVAGCGRSDPSGCPAREGLVCADLAKLRVTEEKSYADAVKASDGNAAASAGICDQSLVDLEVQRSCIADRCADLCALSPCGVVGGGSCAAKCAGLGVADDALDVALVRAAKNPGLCSCGVCIGDDGKPANDGTAKLCSDLFVCH